MPTNIKDNPAITREIFHDDGRFPNSPLFAMLYEQAFQLPEGEAAPLIIEKTFKTNDWKHSWRNGIFDYHHYHSTAHEVIGVYAGKATIQLGGPTGTVFQVRKGDVLVIPAGVAHINLASSSDFNVVGAYADGRDYDLNRGEPGERPRADANIEKVPLPEKDPVYGNPGPINLNWEIS